VGSALFVGGVLRAFQIYAARLAPKIVAISTVLLVSGVIAVNAKEVRERHKLWIDVNAATRYSLDALIRNRDKIVEGGVVGLYLFPAPSAFMTPMIKLYLGLDNISVYTFTNINIHVDEEAFSKAENSSFFSFWGLGNGFVVDDLTDQFKELLLSCRQSNLNPSESEYAKACEANKLQFQQYIKE
jgi:hypothetical protein